LRGDGSGDAAGQIGGRGEDAGEERGADLPTESDDGERWTPPVLRTVAAKEEGISDLMAALDRHFHYLERSGTLRERRRMRLRERVVEVAEQRMRRRLWTDQATSRWLDERLPALESGETTPFAVADALLARSGDLLTGKTT